MFVPFVFFLNIYGDYDHLQVFYKYLDMVKIRGWPIIAHERYFQNIDTLTKNDIINRGLHNFIKNYFLCEEPTQYDLDKLDKYIIPSAFEKTLVAEYASQQECWSCLMQNNHPAFESLIGGMLDDIVQKYNEPIEAVLCFCEIKPLQEAADKRNIPVFNQERGVLRYPFCKRQTAYFNRLGFFDTEELKNRYEQFKQEMRVNPIPMLSRKGIFKLFVNDIYLKDIHLIDQIPEYEIGFSYTLVSHYCFQYPIYNEELLLRIKRKFSNDKILVRYYPGFLSPYGSDNSPTSFHFICKCKRLVSLLGNILFEAMIVGRFVCNYIPSCYSFMANDGLDDNSKGIVPLDFVNFVVFAYLIPMEWMTDIEYLRFRLSNPSEVEIYKRAFEFYTNNISEADLRLYYMTEKREYRLGGPLYFTSGCAAHENAVFYFIKGISATEGSFTWSEGNYSEMIFDLVEEVTDDLSIHFQLGGVYFDDRETHSQIVTCKVNGVVAGKAELKHETKFMDFVIPTEVCANTKQLCIRLEYSSPAVPSNGDDARYLAVAFERMRLNKAEQDGFERKYKEELARLREEKEEKEEELARLREEKEEELARLREEKEEELARLREEKDVFLYSTSWRLTKPIRVVGDFIKKRW